MYPRLESFQETCRAVDPDGRFVSDLARRLGLDHAAGVLGLDDLDVPLRSVPA
jgi:hypothetical protein